jgi:uncharacterized protein with von Willebrand factor type A (vWA) domain
VLAAAVMCVAATVIAACAHAPPPGGGPTLALVILIDRSGSMSGTKIEMTRRAALAAVDPLGDEDLVGVVAFDSAPTDVVRLQRVGLPRPEIAAAIATIEPGGGTEFYPALRDAYAMLSAARAHARHALLLSDGQAAPDGLAELTARMKRDGMTVSTIAIGDADQQLLKLIADGGAGAAYVVRDLGTLPSVFVADLKREMH